MGTVYRIYTFEDDGHIVGRPFEVECKDDDEAINVARQLKNGKAIEVWELDRLVAKLE